MIPLSVSVTVPPHSWAEVAGMWVQVLALEDPLLRAELHRITVHRDADGHAWVDVAGPNAGVRVQSAPPDDYDAGEQS
jgi:hypothetical protein